MHMNINYKCFMLIEWQLYTIIVNNKNTTITIIFYFFFEKRQTSQYF